MDNANDNTKPTTTAKLMAQSTMTIMQAMADDWLKEPGVHRMATVLADALAANTHADIRKRIEDHMLIVAKQCFIEGLSRSVVKNLDVIDDQTSKIAALEEEKQAFLKALAAPITSITLGDRLAGKISEADALVLINEAFSATLQRLNGQATVSQIFSDTPKPTREALDVIKNLVSMKQRQHINDQ